ncbi:MAG: SMP-30/gluconolactonase/LRE family protein [Pseudolysinimonas sp.]
MPVSIDVAVTRWSICGEGPVWDDARGLIYWVDINGRAILTTDYATLATTQIDYPSDVGAAAHHANGGFVAAVATGFVRINEDGTVGHRVDCLTPELRMNDAKTDRQGRLWSGSCTYDFVAGTGALWKLDGQGVATQVLDGFTLPNGLDWSPDGSWFYLVDSIRRIVLKYPFDAETGTVVNTPVELIGAENFSALPDGLTVDSDGNLWIAEYAGSAVHQFSPNGELLRSIAMPTKFPTSCAFAGPNLDELWVTSAALEANPETDPLAGSLFRITGLNAVGMPATAYSGTL